MSTDTAKIGANLDLNYHGHDTMVPSRDANFKMHLARKVAHDETERVRKHEALRLK